MDSAKVVRVLRVPPRGSSARRVLKPLTVRPSNVHRSIRLRVLLILAFAAVAIGCAGSQRTPLMHVPLFTRAGQGEAGLAFRPASPRAEVAGSARFAVTDELRVGGSVGGSTRRRSDGFGDEERRHPSLFTDGFVGAEWAGLIFRFGGLLGAGYGTSEVTTARCAAAASERTVCRSSERVVARTEHVRGYGQLHVAIAPPGIFAAAFALRLPFVFELREVPSREADVSPELGFTHSLLLRRVRFDVQPVWSRAQGFTLHLGLSLRFRLRS